MLMNNLIFARPRSGTRLAGMSDSVLTGGGLLVILLLLGTGIVGPLLALLSQAFAPKTGESGQSLLVAAGHVWAYLQTPALLQSLFNSLWVSLLVTCIVIPLAFAFAWALTRSCMPGKTLLRGINMLPLLAPSLLSAVSMLYWFGNQGKLRSLWQGLGFDSIYGAGGIVLAQCFATFPHALMILVTALSIGDQRLYDASLALGAGSWRKFYTVTLPSARYGVFSAALLVFTLVITDFGIPKVIGGNFPMLATDVFKLVIGQQDFQRGAVVALLLLAPAVLTFAVDRRIQKRQTAVLGAKAVMLKATVQPLRDTAAFIGSGLLALLMLAMFGMAVWASLVQFWPYQLNLTLFHYTVGLEEAGVQSAIFNSLRMALLAALFGPVLVFVGAYSLEKTRNMSALRALARLWVMLPMAVPGLVLGMGSIFFFNSPHNPLGWLYPGMALLVISTLVHYYTTAHMTISTALKSLDPEFEAAGASLNKPLYYTLWRVTLPVCLPALLQVSRYYFIAGMTTISAVVFLYTPQTRLGAVAILNLDEAGDLAAAAAMAVLIAGVNILAMLGYLLLEFLLRRTQAWRTR